MKPLLNLIILKFNSERINSVLDIEIQKKNILETNLCKSKGFLYDIYINTMNHS